MEEQPISFIYTVASAWTDVAAAAYCTEHILNTTIGLNCQNVAPDAVDVAYNNCVDDILVCAILALPKNIAFATGGRKHWNHKVYTKPLHFTDMIVLQYNIHWSFCNVLDYSS